MALVYQIVTFTRAFGSQVQKINQLFFHRLPVIGMVTFSHIVAAGLVTWW